MKGNLLKTKVNFGFPLHILGLFPKTTFENIAHFYYDIKFWNQKVSPIYPSFGTKSSILSLKGQPKTNCMGSYGNVTSAPKELHPYDIYQSVELLM